MIIYKKINLDDAAQPLYNLRFRRGGELFLAQLSVKLCAAVDKEEQQIERQVYKELPYPVAAERAQQRPCKAKIDAARGTKTRL